MTETDSTDGLDLKKRARRRLVGAVALALLAVIVLPIVMDEEPRPLGQDIQIRIPSQDSAAPAAHPPAAPPAVAEAKVEAQATGQTKVDLKSEPRTEPDKAEAEARPQPVEAKAEAQAEIKLEAKAAAKPDAKQEQWVVQLGAYQDQGNVRVLLAKLRELGYPAYTEKVDTESGSRTRVRAGPFATREKAERAQAALKRIAAGGPSGGIVAPK